MADRKKLAGTTQSKPMPVRNILLLSLPHSERAAILARSEYVTMKLHELFHEAGGTIKYGFFMNGGMCSILTVLSDGKSVEVGLVGKEGFVGSELAAGFHSAMTRAIVQAPAEAFRLPADAFVQLLKKSPALRDGLSRYTQNASMQIAQVAACNRIHDVSARLARWLLMSHDRLETDVMPLTHEFLAQMLGIRRASVTVSAGRLQRAGLIRHSRGSVNVLNRKGLEDASCECYQAIRNELKKREQVRR